MFIVAVMNRMGTFTTTLRRELNAQKEEKKREKQRRKEEKEKKGPLIIRILQHTKEIGFGLVYSAAYLCIVYCIILFITLYLPTLLNVILASFDAASTITMAAQCSCLFLTGWIFVISFVIVKKITKIYTNGIKNLFHKE